MITLLIMTDGRAQYLEETLASAQQNLKGPVSRLLIHDDSGASRFGMWLKAKYGNDYEIFSTGYRSGFGGAIISAWKQLQIDDNPWVFHLEDDFVFQEEIDLEKMISVMEKNPHLVQMALKRQPCNQKEWEAGGLIELNPYSYHEHTDGDSYWLEHRNFFTTNPSLYRKSLTQLGWPVGNNSEGNFGIGVFSKDNTLKSGYWGAKFDSPKCIHIGDYRNGAGY